MLTRSLISGPDTHRAIVDPRPHGSARRRRMALVFALLTAIGLIAAACGTASGQGGGAPTATPNSATVKVFFARHPDTDNNPTAVFALTRTTSATSTQDRATFALEELLKGPSQAERAQGYYSPFDGQLALQSYCTGPFRDFDLTLDHKGTTSEQGTATLQFCRRVDIPGDLDGPRMKAMVTSTLMEFGDIKKVVILTYQGDCFDDLQGLNACLDGAQTDYPVKVYFSKHPDSENNFTAVFPVSRTAPDLGVATYAVKQLIAGPTPAEQVQGYYTELTGAINHNDSSSCGGADFTITLDKRGTKSEIGTATLQFCRAITTGGVGADARILSELTATLTQFENVKRVAILTKTGNCFGDESGRNACLNPEQVGYPVVVHLSKHPDSDIAPAKVFVVNRTSPDLEVATHAIGQLIA
jgi:Sporulation and spore germination